jgi:NADH-quinone oxidoreductase subunit M
MLGDVSEKNAGLRDLNLREIAVFAPLLACAFWIGLYPKPFFAIMERPVAQIVERVQPGYYNEHRLSNPLASSASTELPAPTAAP